MITFVTHTNKPGGGELALRRYLQRTNLRVRLVTLEAGGVWQGLQSELVHASGLLALRRGLHGQGLVVANSMRAALLTALVAPRGTPLAFWVRDGLRDSAMSPVALGATKHLTARRISHYLANSEWTAGTIRDSLRTSPDEIEVVHSMCGVTAEMLARPPRNATHAPLRLLALGRISPWKAPHVAIRALQPLRDQGFEATLSIVGGTLFGEDDYNEKLRELASSEPAVTLHGHVDDVRGLLESHDMLLHCSIKPEPFGQVAVQALAHGLPVAATDHGGVKEIVQHGVNGLLYPPGDEYALARAVSIAVSRYTELSKGALLTAARFKDDDLVTTLDKVLLQWLAERAIV